MSRRDLKRNLQPRKIEKQIQKFYISELQTIYGEALRDLRGELTRLISIDPASITRAQRSQLIRNTNLIIEIERLMEGPLARADTLLKELPQVTFQGAYLRTGWALDQVSGVSLGWGMFNPEAVRAAVGLSDNFAALGEVMSRSEVTRHRTVLTRAFRNYNSDSKRWISREISNAVIKGESIPKITKRIKEGLDKSYRSAETIARTETLRVLGLGSQIALDEGEDEGVRTIQVWDATLDNRTRPDHAEMDGRARDEETGLFSTPWGAVPGPRRSGIAAQDINCRCDVVPEVEGYSPELRRIRDEGLQPYQTFTKWAVDRGVTQNIYGQKYNFLIPIQL